MMSSPGRPGLDANHVSPDTKEDVDARGKRGHDEEAVRPSP
jgi:hypothetical protein